MKIAVSAVSGDLSQPVNPVFGRCNGFVIAEVEGKEMKESRFIPNPAMGAAMGAGIAAAQAVAEQQVEAVVTGNVGPNAFMVLNQSRIKVFQAAGISVQRAIQLFAAGKLTELGSSSVAGHFGMGAGKGIGSGRGAGRGAGTGLGGGAGRRRGRRAK